MLDIRNKTLLRNKKVDMNISYNELMNFGGKAILPGNLQGQLDY